MYRGKLFETPREPVAGPAKKGGLGSINLFERTQSEPTLEAPMPVTPLIVRSASESTLSIMETPEIDLRRSQSFIGAITTSPVNLVEDAGIRHPVFIGPRIKGGLREWIFGPEGDVIDVREPSPDAEEIPSPSFYPPIEPPSRPRSISAPAALPSEEASVSPH